MVTTLQYVVKLDRLSIPVKRNESNAIIKNISFGATLSRGLQQPEMYTVHNKVISMVLFVSFN